MIQGIPPSLSKTKWELNALAHHFGDLRPKLPGYTVFKRTCAVEQAVSCIWPVYEAKRALLNTGGSLELGSLHTQGALFGESTSHQPRALIGYWVNQLSSVKYQPRVLIGYWVNQLSSVKYQCRVLIGYWVNQLSSVKWQGGEMLRLVQRTTD